MIIFRQPRQLVEADDVICQKRDQSFPHQITDHCSYSQRSQMDSFPLIVRIIYLCHLNTQIKNDYFAEKKFTFLAFLTFQSPKMSVVVFRYCHHCHCLSLTFMMNLSKFNKVIFSEQGCTLDRKF